MQSDRRVYTTFTHCSIAGGQTMLCTVAILNSQLAGIVTGCEHAPFNYLLGNSLRASYDIHTLFISSHMFRIGHEWNHKARLWAVAGCGQEEAFNEHALQAIVSCTSSYSPRAYNCSPPPPPPPDNCGSSGVV